MSRGAGAPRARAGKPRGRRRRPARFFFCFVSILHARLAPRSRWTHHSCSHASASPCPWTRAMSPRRTDAPRGRQRPCPSYARRLAPPSSRSPRAHARVRGAAVRAERLQRARPGPTRVPGVPGARHVATRLPRLPRLPRVRAALSSRRSRRPRPPRGERRPCTARGRRRAEVARHDAPDAVGRAPRRRARPPSASQRQPASGCDASVVSATNARATSAAASRGRARREGSYAPRARASRKIDVAMTRSSACSSAVRRQRLAGETRNARARLRVHRAKRAESPPSAPVAALGERVSASTAGAGSGDSAEGDEATPRRVHGAWHGEGGRVVRVITQGA